MALMRLLKDNQRYILFLFALFAFRSAVADWNPVPTGSMRPTILEGDVVLVDRLAYDLRIPLTDVVLARLGEPQRGDIVTFTSPANGMRLIKRIVGVPGDVVEMRDNRLVVNGEEARYIALGTEPRAGRHGAALRELEAVAGDERVVQWLPGARSRSSFGPVTVPPDQYLMLGDNRDDSEDSRYIGFVPRDQLIARATRVLVSADILDRWQPRLARTGSRLQ